MDAVSSPPPTETITVTGTKPAPPKSHFWAGSSFSFHDLLDTINPLQHLPIIAPIYRAITGDTIGNVARVVGDGLFGGPIGAASGLVEVAVVEITGEDIGQHLIDLVDGDKGGSPDKSAAPAAAPAPATAPALPPGRPNPAYLSALPQAQGQPSALPQFGNAGTASKLAAAAPISPLDVAKMAAQAQGQAQASAPQQQPAASADVPAEGVALGAKPGIAIDVTPAGIAKMRATSAVHNPAPVALNLPAGALTAMQSSAMQGAPAAQAPADFAERMKTALAKYDALMAARASGQNASGTGTVDQTH
ncbi:MAG TPA: hypothetical protein VM689_14455 [Aliidongia sp.]|nr:hypothetical protein [Aliidongia sp.]